MLPFIEEHLATTKHVVIWDQYLSDSLKATTKQCRGARVRQQLPFLGNVPKVGKTTIEIRLKVGNIFIFKKYLKPIFS